MSGLIMRLAGPLQSWGERSVFPRDRDTAPFPTRSGIIGMLAAAEGLPRHHPQAVALFADLTLTVRVDRPGVRLIDYHTAGGGQPKELTAATSSGGNKGAAVITHRHYLADAAFVIAITGPADRTIRIAHTLTHPHWAPYLGRRACIPDEPLLLRADVDDPITELRQHVPLTPDPDRPATGQDSVEVTFLWEQPPAGQTDAAPFATLYDTPHSFAPHARSHGKRPIYRTQEPVPAALADHGPHTLHQRLIDYALNTPKEVPA